MSVAVSPSVEQAAFGREPAPVKRERLAPIVGWSWVGVAVAALMLYTIAAWILSGDATPTGTGVTPVPDWIKAMAFWQQLVFASASAVLGYWVVIRERRKAGHLTLNGMSYLIIQSAWWQDSFLNYISPQMSYNSQLVNFGTWDPQLPGWVSPNAASMPSPVIWYFGVYPLLFCGGTIGVLWLMRRAQNRWNLGNVRLVAGTFATLAVFAFTFEMFFVRTGMYHYGGFGGPRLFGSHTYAFPIFVPILDAAIWTAWSAILYFRNDRGETIAERGVDRLKIGDRAKSALRLLALFGICHVAYLLCYNGPAQVLGLHAKPWPKDVQERSYFTNGLCGEGTGVACPGAAVPIPRGSDSLRIGPDGRLVVPAGTKPPELVPLLRGG